MRPRGRRSGQPVRERLSVGLPVLILALTALLLAGCSKVTAPGKTAQGTWAPTSGPPDVVLALAVSGTSIFAGTAGSGVFRSTDDGATWTAVNAGLTSRDVFALLVADSVLFAGTARNGGGIFRSRDNGTTWSAVGVGLPSTDGVAALAVKGAVVFAGTAWLGLSTPPNGRGIFRSTDGGAS